MYNLVVFASGNGSTLQAIIDSINENRLNANICLVVSNLFFIISLELIILFKIKTLMLEI